MTFLGAQSFALVADALPMQTYPIGRPGWWADPPAGVKAPPMPDGVRDWAFVPPGAAGPVAAPDPKFLELVTPKSPPGDVLNFQRGTKHK